MCNVKDQSGGFTSIPSVRSPSVVFMVTDFLCVGLTFMKYEMYYFAVANIKDLIASVHEFVEVASLGEFMQRLSLLRAFGTDMFLQGL